MDPRVDQLREDIVLFNRRIRTTNSAHHLTPTQLQALAHIDRLGPLSASELAAVEMVAPQTIARTIAFLAEHELVSREADPTDGRAVLVSISTAGRRMLEEDRGKRSNWLSEMMDERCTTVEKELLFLAGKLLRRLAKAEAPPASDQQ